MKFNVDEVKGNPIYFDKDKSEYLEKDNLVVINYQDNKRIKDIIIDIVSNLYSLNDNEKIVFANAIENKNISYKQLMNKCENTNDKSRTTYVRAFNSLVEKKVLKEVYSSNKIIVENNLQTILAGDINNIKGVVVKLQVASPI